MTTQTNGVEAQDNITRDELLAMGCEEVKNKRGRKGYVMGEEVVAASCSKCGGVKRRKEFSRNRGRFLGIVAQCKVCVNKHFGETQEQRFEWHRKYRETNQEQVAKSHRKYYEENRGQRAEIFRKYREENPEMFAVRRHRRRASINSLPDDLTIKQLTEINASFYNTCALSGEPTDLHADHVIPISIGHGGTTYGNMIPLSSTLNISKSASHIFEWFSANHVRFGLSQRKFDELIAYLADANEMTTQEYRKYVDWCFDNPRVICETTGELVFKADKITQLQRR